MGINRACILVLSIYLFVMGSGFATAASLFLASDVPTSVTENDPNPIELGVKFKSSSAGKITGLRFYKGPKNTGTHTAHLWSAAGTLLASATFTNETASGWQQVNLAAPVAIAANTIYVASYHSNGYYSETDNYFTRARTVSPLTAPDSSSSGGNGVYAYGSAVRFPTDTWLAANYSVDVVFASASAVNSPPVAKADTGFAVAVNSPLTIQTAALLANDTDPNGLPLTVTGVSNPVNGTASLAGAVITFTPKASYTGAASFTYTIQNTAGGTASANVALTVNALAPPVANNDSGFVTPQNTSLTLQASALLANDSDPNKLPLSVTAVGSNVNGSVSLSGTTITFTPTTGYTGSASFKYTVKDTAGLTATGTVSLTVNASASTCSVAYKASGPIVVQSDNQVISNLNITTTSGPGIDTNRHSGVQIKNVTIHHSGRNPGISVNGGTGVTITGADIVNDGAPASGANPSADMNNIACSSSSNLTVNNVKLTRGSNGIYLENCSGSKLSFIEGHDQRGPFPRGMIVQWNGSNNGSLTDFSNVTDVSKSWPEDNINIYNSTGITIARGLLDGNNSPTGNGFTNDWNSGNVTVTDVDAVHMGNGCFGIYGGGGHDVTLTNVRCRDNYCSNARGAPASGGLAYPIDPASVKGNLNLVSSAYYNLCNPAAVVWDTSMLKTNQVSSNNFTPRATITAKLCQ